MSVRRWVVICCMAWTHWASAHGLSEALASAQCNDAQYQAALHGFEAMVEKLPQARAGLLPSVSLSANRSRQNGVASFDYAPFVDRWVNTNNWSVQVTQPLFRWVNWASYQQADAQVRQAEAQLAVAEQDLLLRVLQAYLDVVLAVGNVSVANRHVLAMREQVILAERHFAVGMGVVTDVHEAKSKWLSAQAQQIGAVHELSSKRAELERVTGVPLDVPDVRFAGALPSLNAGELNHWLEGVGQSPAVRMQVAAVEVARRELDKNRGGHMPSLDLTANRGYGFNTGSLGSPADMAAETWSNQVGIQLNVPLFSGGGTQSKVRESTALLLKARDELLGAERSTKTQVRQNFMGILSGYAQLKALSAAVEGAESAVQGNKLGFGVGTRINTEVLNAEQQFYVLQRDLLKLQIDTLVLYARLKSVLGLLQPDDFVVVEQHLAVLSPEQNETTLPINEEKNDKRKN